MIQGTAISLSCNLKKHYLKKLCSIEEVLTTIAHPQTCITSAAATLRADILSYCNAIKYQHWRPTVETVTAEYGSPPD